MSFMTPILMTPSLICACAVPAASTTASAAVHSRRFIDIPPCYRARWALSHSEIVVQFFDIGIQFGVGELVDDTPMLHDVIAIRDGRGEAEILFHQQNGEALLFQGADGLADLLDDDGSKTLGRLVEQQQARTGAQNAADRQHLLLAPRPFRAPARAEPLPPIGDK